MERRNVLKLLAGAAALPMLSRDVLAMFREAYQDLPATTSLKTLNPHQNATVVTIAELIIPKTDTPGATDARVSEFIDVILTDWCATDEKAVFLDGLADVDARSRKKFGKDFVDGTPQQQAEVVKALDSGLTASFKDVADPVRRKRITKPPDKSFFFMMKQLSLVGYYTSEVGFEDELHEEIIPADHAACVPIETPKGTN
jgi:Gluconate 2-dehydrogenase subunit 3